MERRRGHLRRRGNTRKPDAGQMDDTCIWRRIMNKDERIRIELTDEQKKQIKEAGGKEVTSLEFSVRELEERIAPLVPLKYD
jgi:hypothetical protein